MRGRTLIALPLLALLCAPALAEGDAERYRLEKTGDGYVRMDTATGAMSTCREQSGQLVKILEAAAAGVGAADQHLGH